MPLSFPTAHDFVDIFQTTPNLYLILNPDLFIVGVNNAYANATMTVREEILGRHVFAVFPDNPEDDAANGVGNLRSSLEQVIATRKPHVMNIQKYDIRKPEWEGGGFEERYWSPINTPVIDRFGGLKWIIHCVTDVTRLVQSR